MKSLLIVWLIVYLFGLCIFYYLHRDINSKEIFKNYNIFLWECVKEAIRELLTNSSPQVRWRLDQILHMQLIEAVKPYANMYLGVCVRQDFHEGVPAIFVVFRPNKMLVEDDILLVKDMLEITFYGYLSCRNISYPMFIAHYQFSNKIIFIIYYNELACDSENFENRYNSFVAEQCPKQNVSLHNDELERELEQMEDEEWNQVKF